MSVDLASMMRTQMLSLGIMKDDSNMMNIILAIFLMTLLDALIKIVPKVLDKINLLVHQYLEKKTTTILDNTVIKKEKSYILFERDYNTSDSLQYEVVDAILDYISNQNSVKSLTYSGFYMIHNKTEFMITKNIYAKLKVLVENHNRSNKKDEHPFNQVSFSVYSYELELTELKAWINKIHELYTIKKKNNLGDKKYYFNEIVQEVPKDIQGNFMLHQASKRLNFTMTEFMTNKNLTNIFGPHIDILNKRVNLFMNNPEWYEKRGIPHTLGIMLHGAPGCGKTSTIKAIAKTTNRHIINMSLREITTQTQLNNLFYNENLQVVMNGETQNIIIPQEQRIYVIEDIDCLTDIVLSRENRPPKQKAIKKEKKSEPNSGGTLDDVFCIPASMQNHVSLTPDIEYSNNDELNLSYLLNLLDGILEIPGRILIMTSNYPEKIDKAFIRPGRVDISIKFEYADKQMIYDMCTHFYENIDIKPNTFDAINFKYSPAEIINRLSKHYDNPDAAIKELLS